jgi:hypothetical protein
MMNRVDPLLYRILRDEIRRTIRLYRNIYGDRDENEDNLG